MTALTIFMFANMVLLTIGVACPFNGGVSSSHRGLDPAPYTKARGTLNVPRAFLRLGKGIYLP